MRRREVVFSPEAKADLAALHRFIVENSGPVRAARYLARIEAYCSGFEAAGERGTKRDDIRPGLRLVGFERRITMAFHVEPDRITFLRILYGGRDLKSVFSATRPS